MVYYFLSINKKGKSAMKKMLYKLICSVLAVSLLALCFGGCNEDNGANVYRGSAATDSTGGSTSTDSSIITKPLENVEIPEGKTPYAVIDVKDFGKITVKLDPKSAPITVSNFINLAQTKFYDGLTFHRIIEGFMMQGGDPQGNGSGGSDRNIKGEFAQNGVTNNLSHTRGAISMARATPPDSGSSQFFIVHKDSTFLDGQYACFGYVTEGMDIVDKVCTTAQPVDDNGTIPASEQPVINSIKIEYK